MTGSVSGITTMVVTPPAAAAWLAVLRVSRCSWPGSPVNTCMSMRPGQSTWPLQSMTRVASGALRLSWPPRSAMVPSLTSTPPGSSRPDAGSIRRALMKVTASGSVPILRMRGPSPVGQLAPHGLQHRHSHCDAHLHLVADHAAGVVGDGRGDLHAAVHGAWVHDERVGLGAGQLLLVEAEEVEVLAAGGNVRPLHALPLQAEHHDDVGVRQTLVHVG